MLLNVFKNGFIRRNKIVNILQKKNHSKCSKMRKGQRCYFNVFCIEHFWISVGDPNFTGKIFINVTQPRLWIGNVDAYFHVVLALPRVLIKEEVAFTIVFRAFCARWKHLHAHDSFKALPNSPENHSRGISLIHFVDEALPRRLQLLKNKNKLFTINVFNAINLKC